jgi:ABC-type sulfate/molybdate transport systems ATPase subunit
VSTRRQAECERSCACAGGQKHRIALARACYANADVYLLDDPLSAVDAHVGRHLVSECLANLLRGKTRVLVTHQLQFLAEADLVVMMEDGKVSQTGTYAELLAGGATFAEFKMEQGEGRDGQGAAQRDSVDSSRASVDAARRSESGAAGARVSADGRRGTASHDAERMNGAVTASTSGKGADRANGAAAKKGMGALIRKEDRSKGSVDRKVYMTYLRAWGQHLRMPLLFVSIAFTERGFQVRCPRLPIMLMFATQLLHACR